MQAILVFHGMIHRGISTGYDLLFPPAYSSLESLFLCVGKADNRVLVSGTTMLTRQPAVLKAIDELGKWGEDVFVWLTCENGRFPSPSAKHKFRTHVRPYEGALTITAMTHAVPPLTFAGDVEGAKVVGKGRLLTETINDVRYFCYGPALETDFRYRGFDCTSFPMALLSVSYVRPPRYGSQLSDALSAQRCGLEKINTITLVTKLNEDTIPGGLYILFSSQHVFLYNSEINMLYEFNWLRYRKGLIATDGEDVTVGANRKRTGSELWADENQWWMRKLSEDYRQNFA